MCCAVSSCVDVRSACVRCGGSRVPQVVVDVLAGGFHRVDGLATAVGIVDEVLHWESTRLWSLGPSDSCLVVPHLYRSGDFFDLEASVLDRVGIASKATSLEAPLLLCCVHDVAGGN